jgi:hypothetical protein
VTEPADYSLTPEEEDALVAAHGTNIAFDVEMAFAEVTNPVPPLTAEEEALFDAADDVEIDLILAIAEAIVAIESEDDPGSTGST